MNVMLEDLRQKRNTLQQELSALKANGGDTANVIQEMKDLSACIKNAEKQKKQPSEPASTTEAEPLASADFYFWGHQGELADEKDLTCETSQADKPEFSRMIQELEGFEAENAVFPQNSAAWLLAWHYSRPHETLKLTLVRDAAGVIAAFWHAERKMGPLRVIHSAPIGSCDFFDAPMAARANRQQVVAVLLDSLRQGGHDVILLKNVNNHSGFYQGMATKGTAVLSSMKIHSCWLAGDSGPLAHLSGKMRYSIRSKRKKLDVELGPKSVVLKRIKTFPDYEAREPIYAEIFRERWGRDVARDVSLRRTHFLRSLMATGEGRVYEIHAGGEIAGYKIGFLYRNVFWEWKSCIRLDFNRYSLNDIFILELMGKLREEGIQAYNFMAGDYDYKRRWANDWLQTENYHLLIGCSLLGRTAIPGIKFVKKFRDVLRRRFLKNRASR